MNYFLSLVAFLSAGAFFTAAIPPPSQPTMSQPTGTHFVLRIESQFVGDTKEQTEPPSFMLRALPDRWAEWDIVTDGKAFRSRLKRRLRDMPDEAIVLQPGPNSVRFVLNASTRTYYRVQPAESVFPNELEPTDVSVTKTGKGDVISGYPVNEVVLHYNQRLATPFGRKVVRQVEIRDWCTSSVRVSPAVSAAIQKRVTAFTRQTWRGTWSRRVDRAEIILARALR